MMHRSCRCCQHDISTKRAPMIMLVRRKNLVGRENACYEVKLAAAPAGTVSLSTPQHINTPYIN
eukprot:scaffold320433_cov17-Tisochrysis_lutea.AAC.1